MFSGRLIQVLRAKRYLNAQEQSTRGNGLSESVWGSQTDGIWNFERVYRPSPSPLMLKLIIPIFLCLCATELPNLIGEYTIMFFVIYNKLL
jgi:hypothetical protein